MEGDYSKLSKEELIEKIRKLECHVKQLRNVICKRAQSPASANQGNSKKRAKVEGLDSDESNGEQVSSSESPVGSKGKKKQRPFDFSASAMLHEMIKDIEKCSEDKPTVALTDTLMMGSQRKMYVKLRDRPVCGSNDEEDDD